MNSSVSKKAWTISPSISCAAWRSRPPHRGMTAPTPRANAGKSVIRSRVEHVAADRKSRMRLFIHTVGIERAEMKIGLAALLYNIRRFIYRERIRAA